MAFELDLGEVNPETVGKGGDYPPAGKYHVQVIKVDEYGGKNGELIADLEIIAGDPKGHEGKVHREYFSKQPKAMSRLAQLAIVTRITSVEELKRCKAEGRNPVIEWQDCVGRQLCVILENEEYNGKVRPRVNFNLFDIDDDRTRDIPKNNKYIERFRAFTSGTASPPQASQPQVADAATNVQGVKASDGLFD